jgi:hypothetical protein
VSYMGFRNGKNAHGSWQYDYPMCRKHNHAACLCVVSLMSDGYVCVCVVRGPEVYRLLATEYCTVATDAFSTILAFVLP